MKPAFGSISASLVLLVSAAALSAQTAPVPLPVVPPQSASTPLAAVTASQAAQGLSADEADDNPGGSEVRIVRLSQTEGKVVMDRNTGKGFETAFANLPVVQAARLQTEGGVAEVEFEDNSTLRLTPNTLVEFTRLQRNAAGATISTITVLRGTVYVNLEKSKGNSFTLSCGQGSAELPPSSRVRLTVTSPQIDFAVFKGDVEFRTSSATTTQLGKNKELLVTGLDQTRVERVAAVEEGSYDQWNEDESKFHKAYSKGSTLSGSPYLYGVTDLNYYGSFANLGDCGRVWRPYFASAAWDPFANGFWAWYPGSGYTWVSAYPWGWAPFHYGSWEMCSTGAWGWVPGGAWSGLRYHHDPGHPFPPGGPIRHPFPPRPPRGPVQPTATLMAVNTRPLQVSGLNPVTRSFVFRNDSAGAGIPREAFGKLDKASEHVEQHGTASVAMAPVYSGPSNGGRPGREGTSWRPVGGSRAGSQAGSGNSRSSGNAGGGGGYHSGGSSSSSSGGGSRSGGSSGSSSSSSASSSSSSSGASSASGSHH